MTDDAAMSPRDDAQAAAPAWRRVLAQTGFEVRAVLRNGEQLLLTLVLPMLILGGLTRTSLVSLDTDDRIAVVAPGALALAVLSTAFTSQAIATGFDRRSGVLRLLATTPLGRGGLLAGKILAVLVVEAGQVLLLGGAAVWLGWRPVGLAAGVLLLALGTAAFVALGLLVAGVLRAEAVLALANLVWILLLTGGAVLLPAARLPDGLAVLARALPSGALGEGLRQVLAGGALDIGPVAVLTAWAVACGALAIRWFRWE